MSFNPARDDLNEYFAVCFLERVQALYDDKDYTNFNIYMNMRFDNGTFYNDFIEENLNEFESLSENLLRAILNTIDTSKILTRINDELRFEYYECDKCNNWYEDEELNNRSECGHKVLCKDCVVQHDIECGDHNELVVAV
jgi:hypothetical protein